MNVELKTGIGPCGRACDSLRVISRCSLCPRHHFYRIVLFGVLFFMALVLCGTLGIVFVGGLING